MLDALLLVVGAAVGAGTAWAVNRRREREHTEAQRRAALERDRAHAKAKYLDRRLEVRTKQLERATRERDDYAKIASTHQIEPRGFGKGQWVRKVWQDRRYSGHPADNLQHLRADFEAFGQEHVLMTLDIELLGGWKTLLEPDQHDPGPTTPLSAGQALLLEGPADRVLGQLTTFLLDDDTGFVEPRERDTEAQTDASRRGDQDDRGASEDDVEAEDDEAENDEADADTSDPVAQAEQSVATARWRDADSPMVWRLTVDVLEGQTAPPEIEFVEVLRIQEKIVEQVVERPVVRTVPPEVTSHLCNHTTEELVTLIEAVLEVRELSHEHRLAAQAKALEGLVADQGPRALNEPTEPH